MKEEYIGFIVDGKQIEEILNWMFGECESQPKKEEHVIPTNIEYYIQKVADKMEWKFEKTDNYLTQLYHLNIMSVINILLKEIAIEIDKKYPDHISKSADIYGVSSLNGKTTHINKESIKNYRNFAAFKSIEDAQIAQTLMRDFLDLAFNGRK